MFYRMNTKSSIFTSGEAWSEFTTFDLHERKKIDLTRKLSNFQFLFCFEMAIIQFNHDRDAISC